jgi:hypothetical protein
MAKPKSASNSQNNSMSGAQPEPQTGAGFAPGGVIVFSNRKMSLKGAEEMVEEGSFQVLV